MPYYGRGGAGNIQAAAQEKERIAADPEAQLASSEQPSIPPGSGHGGEAYKPSGRGGAGNYFAASDDAKLPASQAEIDAASKPMSPGALPKYGRGGAGNIYHAAGEKADRDESAKNGEQKMQQRVAQAVEQRVEEQLAVPQKARLPMT